MAKIIYHCYGGSHSSVTAAGIHLGMLSRKRTAKTAELLGVPHYDQYQSVTHGRFRFIGRDILGNEVFVLGKRTAGPDTTIFLHKIAELFNCGKEIRPVDTTFPINPLMVIGGFLSRGLNLVSLGRPIVLYGTQIAYPFLVKIAEDVLQAVKKEPALHRCLPSFAEYRVLFYICPENDLLSLLLAGLHLNPEIKDQDLVKWVTELDFSGKIGAIQRLGITDNYELYLVGAGREPEIMARILRETRILMEIPQVCLCIVQSQQPSSLLLKCVRKIQNYFLSKTGAYRLIKIGLHNIIKKSRQEVYTIKTSLREGILD